MLGAPVTCNHKADPLLFGQQCNVMRRLPGDKAVRPAVDGLLQVAAAPPLTSARQVTARAPLTYLTPVCSVSAQNFASASTVVGIVVPMRPQPSAKLSRPSAAIPRISQSVSLTPPGAIEIGVHADGGDAVFHQQRGHIIGGQTFDGLEDDRMVADN